MNLADMKLMLKLAGWRLRSKSAGVKGCRSWYVVDDKDDLRSRYYESQYDAAEWGILVLVGDEEDMKRYKQKQQDLLRIRVYEALERAHENK